MSEDGDGWTPETLQLLARLRGWTPDAIRRLGVSYDRRTGLVVFTVRDETGEAVGAVRYQPDPELRATRPKTVADRGTPRQLFPGPEMIGDAELTNGRVFLPEGEPDGMRLWSLGLAAVAVPGAQNWRDEWATRFTGRRLQVIVCFDCDETGRSNARRAAAALTSAGVDARILDLDPRCDDGYDLTDYLAHATSAEQRQQAAALLCDLADNAPAFTETKAKVSSSNGGPPGTDALALRSFADHRGRRVSWLRPGVPYGNVTTLAGDGGLGKSTLALAWTCELVADGESEAVVIVAEDGADIAKLRLRALEARLERIHFVVRVFQADDEERPDYESVGLQLPAEAAELDRLVSSRDGRVRLLVVDPWAENLDVHVDAYQAKSVRTALAALRSIAARHELACLVIAHLNKGASTTLKRRLDGSGALYDGSRSVFLLGRTPGSPEDGPGDVERVLVHEKCNVAEKLQPRDYMLRPIVVLAEGGEPPGSVAILEAGDESAYRAGDLLTGSEDRASSSSRRARRDEARAFLLDCLQDGGTHERVGLLALAAAQGIGRNALDRAYDELVAEGIAARRHHGGWRLANVSQSSGAGLTHDEVGKSRVSKSEMASTRDWRLKRAAYPLTRPLGRR